MKPLSQRWQLWILWAALLLLLVVIVERPVASGRTRVSELALGLTSWFVLIGLVWRWRAPRNALLALTALAAIFLLLPARSTDKKLLRSDSLAALRRYDGVHYVLGGESPNGIDCSGLVRRGLIDAVFSRGIRTANAGLVRAALSLWWHDCSARELGALSGDRTMAVQDVPALDTLDHALIQPGDLAVTDNGVHCLAYLGDRQWIEADPGNLRVVIVPLPSDNPYLHGRMKIVRWRVLE